MATAQKGRLQSRPSQGKTLGSTTTGLRRTGLETDRDGILYVPESFDPKKPTPLIVMLHGAGGDAHHSVDPLRDLVDHTGAILLAPESQRSTWDVISTGGFGQDVHFIDEALEDAFALYPIDPKRVAIGGFSDGASYALSLGLTNGDLFTHIMAFSPGFAATKDVHGKPSIFISHGRSDDVLPIDTCSRQLVPRLRESGFDVTYEEFDGGHTIPTEIGRRAFIWYLGTEAIEETKGTKVRSAEAGIEFT